MSDTATQEGVETEVSDRDRLIADIASRREAELAKENDREVQEPSDAMEAAPVEEISTEGEAPVEQEVVEAKAVPMQKIVVDGEEREVPQSQILEAGIRALQKQETGDKRLEEATKILREAQTMVGGTQQKPPSDEDLIWYAQEGTADQQVLARNEIARRQQATADGLVQEVTRRTIEQVRFDDAAPWFAEEYKDVLSDPILVQIAGQRATVEEERMRKGEISLSHRQVYKAIGDDLRAWVNGLRGSSTDSKTFEAKREQKSNITTLKTASSRRTAPDEPPAPTASTIIEEMRRARGGH